MIINKTKGLIAAPFTPMNSDGSLNLKVIPDYAARLKKDKLKGVFICGTTGEGMLMTNEERKKLAEKWIPEQTENFKVIVHVGTTSSKQSFQLANHAEKIGAYAVGCMGPSFLSPGNIEELVDFCKEAASGSPDLPFYYYHIPSVSGVRLPMAGFIETAKQKIPNLAGIKFTDNNFTDMMQCLRLDNGKWDILHGYDELLLAGLAYGVKGAIGSTYNFMAPFYYDIISDFEKGDMKAAGEKQAQSLRVVEILNKYGGSIAAGKAFMKKKNIDCGPCRPPIKNLDNTAYKNIMKDIESLDFLSWQ
jgi:N-acetylneuraminate lyase